MRFKETKICLELGYAIYDVLPRGSDGEKIEQAIRSRIHFLISKERDEILAAVKAKAVAGALLVDDVVSIVAKRSA